MNRRDIKLVIVLGIAMLGWGCDATPPGWPSRPVTIIVPAGAGGGTDQTARMLAKRLKEKFGQPFNVVNRGQGSGVVGLRAIAAAEPDGYNLGIIYNFAHYLPLGQAQLSVKDFTPVAQYNFDPAAFHVRADSDWHSLPEALNAIKADPGAYTIACGGGCGGSWPIAVLTLFEQWGIKLDQVRMVPGQGAAAALQDLAAGGVDVVPSSIAEAGPLIDDGRIKSLAVFGSKRLAAFPKVPTLQEAAGIELSLGAWRGLVGPAGLPDEIADKLEISLQEIVSSKDWQQEMTARGFGVRWRTSAEFEVFMLQQQTEVRAILENFSL